MERIADQQHRLDSGGYQQFTGVAKVLPGRAGGPFVENGCRRNTVFDGELTPDFTFSRIPRFWRAASEDQIVHSPRLVKRDRLIDPLPINWRGFMAPRRSAQDNR